MRLPVSAWARCASGSRHCTGSARRWDSRHAPAAARWLGSSCRRRHETRPAVRRGEFPLGGKARSTKGASMSGDTKPSARSHDRVLRVLVVDDEAPARARLRRLLLAHPQITVVAEARNGREALELADAHKPDALFLDVQMPEGDGLSVAVSLPDPAPAIVFVTAFDHYALPAFDAAALDYVLKPADAEHVARAVQRLLARGPRTAAARPTPSQLLIPDRGRTWV